MAAATPDFVPIIEAEVAAVRRFVVLLGLEQEMLIKGEVGTLIALVGEKNGLAAELTALAARRSESLAAAGLTLDRAGMAAWFAAHPKETHARAIWSSLLSLASQARELNRSNGELIQMRMQHNALALETLLGTSTSLSLYGPDGQSTPPSGRCITDSA